MAHHDLILMLHFGFSVRVDVLPDDLPDLWPSDPLGDEQELVLLHRDSTLHICSFGCITCVKASERTHRRLDTTVAEGSNSLSKVVYMDVLVQIQYSICHQINTTITSLPASCLSISASDSS